MTTPDRSRQLALDLPHPESMTRDNFLEGPSNATALGLIDRWPDWPNRIMILVGPEGSGKSHLAAIFAERSGARSMRACDVREEDLPTLLATGAAVLEGLTDVAVEQPALFHFMNMAREAKAFVLITARTAPAALSFSLPDLGSRLRAIPVVQIGSPDDQLFMALLVKFCADRQMSVDASVISYVAARIERSVAAARATVERLDREALRLRRPVTRALAAELLREPDDPPPAA